MRSAILIIFTLTARAHLDLILKASSDLPHSTIVVCERGPTLVAKSLAALGKIHGWEPASLFCVRLEEGLESTETPEWFWLKECGEKVRVNGTMKVGKFCEAAGKYHGRIHFLEVEKCSDMKKYRAKCKKQCRDAELMGTFGHYQPHDDYLAIRSDCYANTFSPGYIGGLIGDEEDPAQRFRKIDTVFSVTDLESKFVDLGETCSTAGRGFEDRWQRLKTYTVPQLAIIEDLAVTESEV